MSDHLPLGWARVPLSSSVYFQEGPGLRKWQFGKTGVPFLNIRTFVNGRIDRTKCQFVKLDEFTNKYEHFLLHEGDIVVSSSGTLGKLATVQSADLPVMLNTSTIRFRTRSSDVLTQDFLRWYLQSPEFFSQIESAKTGSAIFNYGPSHLNRMEIVLPPLDEQKRLAETLDALSVCVHGSRTRIARLVILLKRFRQAVLAAACSGKLTEDWREIHAGGESVASLRQGIATERVKAWESVRFAKHRKRRYPEPAALDEAELPEIPEVWTWVPADEVCSQITDGEHIQPRYKLSGLPMITATHVRDGFVEFKDVGLISEEDFRKCLERCAPAKDDILIVSVGATTGRAAIVPKCPPFAMVRSVLMLRPLLEPKFLLRWIQSRWCQTWISQASGASAQPHFYIHDNKRMPVPLPPTSEQTEIVRRVDSLFALANAVEGHVSAATLRADKLSQSILAKAFRGELVPTEAELARREGREYEPASTLLERIKKERNSGTPTKATRQRTRSNGTLASAKGEA